MRAFPRAPAVRRRGRILKPLLLGVPALALVLAAGVYLALPQIVTGRVAAYTGCPVEAAVVRVNPFRGTLEVTDLRVQNPDGFPEADFVDVAHLDVQVRPLSLRRARLEIPRLHVRVPRITLVTRADGASNVLEVRRHTRQADGAAPAAEPEQQILIGDLIVQVDELVLVDYSRGGEPVRRTLRLDIDRHFTDVTDLGVVARALAADAARHRAPDLLALGTLLPGRFGRAMGEFVQDTGGWLRTTAAPLGGALKKLIDSRARDSKP